MSPLTVKRLIVVVVSQAIGFLLGYIIISFGFDLLPFVSPIQTPKWRTIEEYGNIYVLVTAVPLGIIVMIWMDAILDTRILPD